MDPLEGLRVTRMRGTSPTSAEARMRRYPADRVCSHEGCATRLSIYNGRLLCWQHEAPSPFVFRVSHADEPQLTRKAG